MIRDRCVESKSAPDPPGRQQERARHRSCWPRMTAPLLIDGGLSTVLEAAGHDLDHPLWTARLIDEQPDALVAAHLAYLRAGARCLTTASYQLSFEGYQRVGRNARDAERALRRSVALAHEAIAVHRQESGDRDPIRVAASVGPYGALLADGSEYRGDYAAADNDIREFHRRRMAVLEDTRVDCLAIETMPSIREAAIVAKLLEGCTKPAWLAFSCRDGEHINDGTPIAACADLLRHCPGIFAVGINCTAPRHATALIRALRPRAGNKHIIVYPNAGDGYDAAGKCWQTPAEPVDFAAQARGWIRAGSSIVGGCCRIGPDQIAEVARSLAPP